MIIAAVNAIVDDIYILTAQFAHRLCHVAAIGGKGRRIPAWHAIELGVLSLGCFEPSRMRQRTSADRNQFRTSGLKRRVESAPSLGKK